MRKTICVILALSFFFIAAFAGYQLIREHKERQESADSYSELEEFLSFPEVPPSEENDETVSTESGETELVPAGPAVDFTELTSINDDCIAWICIEGTAVNYPVVQGSDNSYYLISELLLSRHIGLTWTAFYLDKEHLWLLDVKEVVQNEA